MVSTAPYSVKVAFWKPAPTVGRVGRMYIPRTAAGVVREVGG